METEPNIFLTAGWESFSLSDSPADLSVSASVDLIGLSAGEGASVVSSSFGAPKMEEVETLAFAAKIELEEVAAAPKRPAFGAAVPNLMGVPGVQVLLAGAGFGSASFFSCTVCFSASASA